jgi:hypothetical protein
MLLALFGANETGWRSPAHRSRANHARAVRDRSPALPPPLNRNHRPPFLPAPPAPNPLFEIEHLGRGISPRRSRRNSGAINRRDGSRRNRPSRSRPARDPRSARRRGGAFARPTFLVCSKESIRTRPSQQPIGSRRAPHFSRKPALRSPSSMWAWSSGRLQGTRFFTYMSNAAGAIAIAFCSASFASSIWPSWPSAAASQR